MMLRYGVCAAMGWCLTMQTHAQFEATGYVEDWIQENQTWSLNATGAGTSFLLFHPIEPVTSELGLTCRIRWKQALSGSLSNFSRLHWLCEVPESIPIEAWQNDTAYSAGSFMHLGETGATDTIGWFQVLGSGGAQSGDLVPLYSTLNSAFPNASDVVIEWQQPPGSDSVVVFIYPNADDLTQRLLFAQGVHLQPTCFGFSAAFTTSHAQDFEVELVHYGPFEPDTLPPRISSAMLHDSGSVLWTFNEPIVAQGIIRTVEDTLPVPLSEFLLSSNVLQTLSTLPWSTGNPREFAISGFRDLAGNAMTNDTVVSVFALNPFGCDPEACLFTELCIDSESGAEWVEVLNITSQPIDMLRLRWWDGSTSTESVFEASVGWDGLLDPGARALIIMQEGGESFIAPFQLKVRPASTLHNQGETLQLKRTDGLIVSEIAYASSWRNPELADDFRLQKYYLTSCNARENWQQLANSNPSTPGLPSSLESEGNSTDSVHIESLVPWGPGHGKATLSHPAHPLHPPSIKGGLVFLDDLDSFEIHWHWVEPLSDSISVFDIHFSSVQHCFSNQPAPPPQPQSLAIYRFPLLGDLVITEIAHHPEGLSQMWGEFVEILNTSMSDTIELSGCVINGQRIDHRAVLAPGRRLCVQTEGLGDASGKVMLQSASGMLLDRVDYRECWHRDRTKMEGGFSLVRMAKNPLPKPHYSWRDWDSSQDERGCSPGMEDPSEAGPPINALSTDQIQDPLLCGTYGNYHVVLLPDPRTEFSDEWEPLHPELHGSFLNRFEPHSIWKAKHPETLCDAHLWGTIEPLSPGDLRLNEVRQLQSKGAEPFIELANASDEWGYTAGWNWTSDDLPFPSDWEPITQGIQWFIPPKSTVVLAECPQRIDTPGIALGSDLPSLWLDFALQINHAGQFRDSVHIHAGRKAPWHTANHSLERMNAEPTTKDLLWNSSLATEGHTAGLWNSWQTLASAGETGMLSIVQDTWHIDPSAGVIPIAAMVSAPGDGGWSVETEVYDAKGMDLDAFGNSTWVVSPGEHVIIRWDGTSSRGLVAPGPYLFCVQLTHLTSRAVRHACAPVHMTPL